MYTLRKHFNTEKDNSTPNIADFKIILSKLRDEAVVIEKTEKKILSPMFAIFNIHNSMSRVYAYGAVGFAALILMIISNTGNTNNSSNANLAMNTQPVSNTQTKTSPVNEAINVVDSIDSFGQVSQ